MYDSKAVLKYQQHLRDVNAWLKARQMKPYLAQLPTQEEVAELTSSLQGKYPQIKLITYYADQNKEDERRIRLASL